MKVGNNENIVLFLNIFKKKFIFFVCIKIIVKSFICKLLNVFLYYLNFCKYLN